MYYGPKTQFLNKKLSLNYENFLSSRQEITGDLSAIILLVTKFAAYYNKWKAHTINKRV